MYRVQAQMDTQKDTQKGGNKEAPRTEIRILNSLTNMRKDLKFPREVKP